MDSLAFKRRDNMKIDVVFVTDGVATDLGDGTESGKLGIKKAAGYGTDVLASAAAWTKTGTGASAVYSFSISLNTTEIDTAFVSELDSVPAMLEIEWVVGLIRTSSNTLVVDLQNDVIRGDEGVPTAGNPPYPTPGNLIVWRPDITGLTGGAGKLESVQTFGVATGYLLVISTGGALGFYELQPGAATTGSGDVAPLDYDADTNSKKWVKVL